MVLASELKTGAVLRLDRELHKVIESVTHAGGGKSGTMVHSKLRSLATGHVTERRFAPDDKLQDVAVTRAKMQFLFKDGEAFTFMHSETFEQTAIQRSVIGPGAVFLKENEEFEVEFYEEKPLAVLFPEVMELAVTSTAAGIRGQGDSAPKEAVLENGLTVHVPQFIKEGDHVRVAVETGKYLDRVSDREVKGAKFSVSAPPVRTGKPQGKPEEKK